ncbi:MAG TPA: helix-hairpin-helix domain-containing protein [Thermoplasmata archaeon]|nr:helix-hairpin-helix domain-containing protein [Thermoplasmata archaeon]
MAGNAQIAEILLAIADLLELKNERFKPEAYRRAARSILGGEEDLRVLQSQGLLGEIPGVGDAIRKKIEEFLSSGKIEYYEQLKSQIPPGVIALMRIPGIGPKTASRFHRELGVDGPAALLEAIGQGRLDGVAGFGSRKIEKLRHALAEAPAAPTRRLSLREGWALAQRIVGALAGTGPLDQVEVAGSLRRRRETVGDLDILVTSENPVDTIARFAGLPAVREVLLQGDTKCTVIVEPGVQVDLRVVPTESFGAALQYFTGSKDHNVRLRTWAKDHGLKINEYGVYRDEVRVAGRSELEVYGSLGLPLMPPEIRENQGELDAAIAGKVPPLVAPEELRGELHRHLDPGERDAALPALMAEAAARRFEYVGVVLSARSEGAEPSEAIRKLRALWKAGAGPGSPRLLIGWEAAIGPATPRWILPNGADFGVLDPARPSSVPPQSPDAGPPSERPWFVGHLSLSSAPTESVADAAAPWIQWAARAGVALEITSEAGENGLDGRSARRAVDAGVAIVISAGAGPGGSFEGLDLAIGLARRGWVPRDRVLNATVGLGLRPERR